MRLCDEHPNVYQWASESIKIPYRHPFTGKYTVYVPDFFIVYQDKEGRKHAEMVEVKPMSQTTMESAGKSQAKKKGCDKHGQVGGRKCVCQAEKDKVQGSIRRAVVPQRQT
jgi:hypothetical protein